MQIKKKPYKIAFAGNSPEFVLRTSPYHNSGRCVSKTYLVNRLPEGTLRLSYGLGTDMKTWAWTVVSGANDELYKMTAAPSGSAETMLDIIEGKIVWNPELRTLFDIKAWVEESQLFLKITSKEHGAKNLFLVYAENANLTAVTCEDGVSGATRSKKQNYRVEAFFSGTVAGKTFTTPEMLLEDSNESVRVACSMVNAWFPKPDIPSWGQFFTAEHCKAATMDIRLWFGEMYSDSPDKAPELRTLSRGPLTTLVNGRMEEYAAMNNIPDWTGFNDDHLHLKAGPDIFGQDNGETMVIPPATDQYIYIYNYSGSDITVRVQEAAVYADGTTDDDANDENLTLKPGVNRITVRDDDAVAWSVTITDTTFNRTITRNYVTRAYQQGFHTFLMLNRLNLYESFHVEFLAREEQSEGERRIIAGIDGYGTTDSQTVFRAKCQPRSAAGLKLMKSAFAKQDNMLIDGQYAWYIDMIPGSLIVSDESEDLAECEFQFRLRKKVNRKKQIITEVGLLDAPHVDRIDTEFR